MKKELLFQYRFYKCIESHVFFDNYFSPIKAKSAAKNIRAHIDRLSKIENTNLRSSLDALEVSRYFNRNGRKKKSLLASDIEYAQSFLNWIKQHHKVGAPKMLFKPAMFTLGAIDNRNKNGYSPEFLKNAFRPGGLLKTGIAKIFEDPLGIHVHFPHLNPSDPIGDLRERIVISLKKNINEDEWVQFLKIAAKFARTDRKTFGEMVTVGNRYIYPLNPQSYLRLLKRADNRAPSEYSYIEEYSKHDENAYLKIATEIEAHLSKKT